MTTRKSRQTVKPRPPRFPPTEAQVALTRLLANRFRLRLPIGFEQDYRWVKCFLDCFAYDPETNEGGLRRLQNIRQWLREGRDHQGMADKLQIPVEHVDFIVNELTASGHRTTVVVDTDLPLDLLDERDSLRAEAAVREVTEPLHELTEEDWERSPFRRAG